jgi:pyrroline-5-carboxylate reductase
MTKKLLLQKKRKEKIAFIGSGNMAEALVCGLLNSGLIGPACITSTDPRDERRRYMEKKYKIRTTTDNCAAVRNADVILIAVKPQQIETLLTEIGPVVRSTQLVISIAAGITTGFIEKFFQPGTPVVRVMPNTPALVGEGAIAVAAGSNAAPRHIALSKKLLSTAGIVVELPENAINAVTALSGSGPAYVFFLAEAMEKAGVEMGLPAETAALLTRQTIFGAGKMLVSCLTPATELRCTVTSPGGTTAAAIEHMEKKRFTEIVCQALARAKDRARELAK